MSQNGEQTCYRIGCEFYLHTTRTYIHATMIEFNKENISNRIANVMEAMVDTDEVILTCGDMQINMSYVAAVRYNVWERTFVGDMTGDVTDTPIPQDEINAYVLTASRMLDDRRAEAAEPETK